MKTAASTHSCSLRSDHAIAAAAAAAAAAAVAVKVIAILFSNQSVTEAVAAYVVANDVRDFHRVEAMAQLMDCPFSCSRQSSATSVSLNSGHLNFRSLVFQYILVRCSCHGWFDSWL